MKADKLAKMSNTEKLNYYSKIIESNKNEAAKIEGRISAITEQLKEMNIHSEEELHSTIKMLQKNIDEKQKMYDTKMRNFENAFAEYLQD